MESEVNVGVGSFELDDVATHLVEGGDLLLPFVVDVGLRKSDAVVLCWIRDWVNLVGRQSDKVNNNLVLCCNPVDSVTLLDGSYHVVVPSGSTVHQ